MSDKRIFGTAFAALALFAASASWADAILVDPDSEGSSVTIEVDGDCYIECWASTILEDSLDGPGTLMELGDSWTFDFFEITVGGLGYADAVINATLAFIAPDVFVTGSGTGQFFTFLGYFSGGSLVWDQPAAIDLGDGSMLYVSFEEFTRLGFGSHTNVTATVERLGAVPEPGTLALLGLGLVALAGVSRRRRVRR